MKERPILFSSAMVRALLDGRKTQTRRIIKTMNNNRLEVKVGGKWRQIHAADPNLPCPYGQPGDRLWVRETFGVLDADHQTPDCKCYYKADCREGSESDDLRKEYGYKYKPSIHMPRWASRITLEIVSVRVERLNDISEQDALAEGMKGITKDRILVKYGIPDSDGQPGTDNYGWPWNKWCTDPRGAFFGLWESINGAGSWQQNPWVWVVEFKRVQI